MTGQLDHINHAEMEHFSFSVITEGSKYFAIVGARLYDTLIQSNQTISTIDRQVNGDWNISLGSLNIWNKMWRIEFGKNSNDGIGVSPPRITGSIIPQVTG